MALAAPSRLSPRSVIRAGSAPAMPPRDDEFARFVAIVRQRVDARLAAWLDARVRVAETRGPAVGAMADALRQLGLRGGKRLRAALLAAAYSACNGEGGIDRVAMALVAMELFQVYLLVHDDWMDGDATRRGGPSVPALMRAYFGGRLGDAASVLAGDLASGWAKLALSEVDVAADRLAGAQRELARAEEDVVEGQLLDMAGVARDLAEVEQVHLLKTASYSTAAPVTMGARLAGANDATVDALRRYAFPLGVAFQLRDDVLGTFGDPASMGKPAGNDLRAGRRSAVVVEALADAGASAAVAHVLGRAEASDAEVRDAVARIERCGARDRVEARIAARVAEARRALDAVDLPGARRFVLEGAVGALTERNA
jgi:geranylgeranyl diphosphate synthase, type I